MKYYITQIITTDATAILTEAAEGVGEAALKNAKMKYHQILSSAYANENVTELLVYIVDATGGMLLMEHWEANPVSNEG